MHLLEFAASTSTHPHLVTNADRPDAAALGSGRNVRTTVRDVPAPSGPYSIESPEKGGWVVTGPGLEGPWKYSTRGGLQGQLRAMADCAIANMAYRHGMCAALASDCRRQFERRRKNNLFAIAVLAGSAGLLIVLAAWLWTRV